MPRALICCSNSFHPSVFRLLPRCWTLAVGICSDSVTRASVKSDTGVGWMPGSQLVFQFIPKVSDEVELKVMCRSVKFFCNKVRKLCLYGSGFVVSGIFMLKQETVATKFRTTGLSKIWSCAVASRLPFIGTKEPR